jgi:ferredoxin-NADP reductase
MKAKIQKSIEVIINSNINTVMEFYAGGNAEMVGQVKKLLCFLGVQESQITTEYSNQ